jgi:C4-type Zn-finger protein
MKLKKCPFCGRKIRMSMLFHESCFENTIYIMGAAEFHCRKHCFRSSIVSSTFKRGKKIREIKNLIKNQLIDLMNKRHK